MPLLLVEVAAAGACLTSVAVVGADECPPLAEAPPGLAPAAIDFHCATMSLASLAASLPLGA